MRLEGHCGAAVILGLRYPLQYSDVAGEVMMRIEGPLARVIEGYALAASNGEGFHHGQAALEQIGGASDMAAGVLESIRSRWAYVVTGLGEAAEL